MIRRTESLSAIEQDDDVERTVLQLELEQIEQELAFFHETYGWDIEYRETETVNVTSNGTDDPLDVVNDILSDSKENDEDTPNALSPASPNILDDDPIVENGVADAEKQRERTSDEVSAELKSVQDDIARMQSEKEEIQKEINEAVANDQFGLAGQMAPKKKKLIAQTAEKEQIAQRLSKELEECIERESQRQSANDIADILGDTDTLAVPEQLDDISTMDSVVESNDTVEDTGQNGIR